jgi:SAM-dependent methyltransferase
MRAAASARGMAFISYPVFDSGAHPQGYVDFECRFAAWHLARERPATLLDIGSYRGFVIGLSAAYAVTSLDVRERTASLGTERVVTGDARQLPLEDASFDAVVSLSSVEHFGLGRYGDALDPDADAVAVREMKRVVRPGGVLILTTTATGGQPTLAFNAHRIYAPWMVREWLADFEPVDERFFSHALDRECGEDEIARQPGDWDVYCACWRRPGAGGEG